MAEGYKFNSVVSFSALLHGYFGVYWTFFQLFSHITIETHYFCIFSDVLLTIQNLMWLVLRFIHLFSCFPREHLSFSIVAIGMGFLV